MAKGARNPLGLMSSLSVTHVDDNIFVRAQQSPRCIELKNKKRRKINENENKNKMKKIKK